MTVVCGGTELLFMSLINTSVTFYKCCKISSNLWSFSFEMKTFFPNFNSCFFLSSSLWFCFLLQWRRRVQRWTLCVRTVSVSPRGGTVTVNLTVKTALMRVRKSAVSTHTHTHTLMPTVDIYCDFFLPPSWFFQYLKKLYQNFNNVKCSPPLLGP